MGLEYRFLYLVFVFWFELGYNKQLIISPFCEPFREHTFILRFLLFFIVFR